MDVHESGLYVCNRHFFCPWKEVQAGQVYDTMKKQAPGMMVTASNIHPETIKTNTNASLGLDTNCWHVSTTDHPSFFRFL